LKELELLTTQELIKQLKITRATLYRWLDRGFIPQSAGLHFGRIRRWVLSDVKQAISKLQEIEQGG